MFKLYDLGNNVYKIETNLIGSREGSLREIVNFAVFEMNIDPDEIEYALIAMNALDHDAANFGSFGSFVFSFSTKELQNVG